MHCHVNSLQTKHTFCPKALFSDCYLLDLRPCVVVIHGLELCTGDNLLNEESKFMHNQLIDEANLAMVNHTVLLTSDGKAKLFGCTWQRKWLCHQKYHRPHFAPLFAPPEIPDVTSTHVIYTQASPGGFHVALLRSDGKVVIIGCNDSGQCNIPPELGAGRCCIQVAAGFNHTVFLMDDGTAIAFGSNNHTQCDLPKRLPDGVHGYTQVAAGFVNTVLLQSDGMAVACGDDENDQRNIPALPKGISYTQVDAGGDKHITTITNEEHQCINIAHIVLLRSDGTAVAVGANHCGQCDIPALPEGVEYIQVSAGGKHTLLLKSDGTIAACGYNAECQCSVPNTYGRDGMSVPMQYTDIWAGVRHSVLLRADGVAIACGRTDGCLKTFEKEEGVTRPPFQPYKDPRDKEIFMWETYDVTQEMRRKGIVYTKMNEDHRKILFLNIMSAQSANEAVLSGINGKEILRFALDPADDDMIKIRQLYLKAIVGIPGKFFVVMPSRKTMHEECKETWTRRIVKIVSRKRHLDGPAGYAEAPLLRLKLHGTA